MIRTIFFVLLAAIAFSAAAKDVYQRGYAKRDGTYVAPHYQTAPDGKRSNNYSTQGNVNPHTGQAGHVNPFPPPGSSAQRQSGYKAPRKPY